MAVAGEPAGHPQQQIALNAGWSFGDALYMTVIALSTVGFQEVQPLSTGERLFTISVILIGVGAVFKFFTSFLNLFTPAVEYARFLGSRVFVTGIDQRDTQNGPSRDSDGAEIAVEVDGRRRTGAAHPVSVHAGGRYFPVPLLC